MRETTGHAPTVLSSEERQPCRAIRARITVLFFPGRPGSAEGCALRYTRQRLPLSQRSPCLRLSAMAGLAVDLSRMDDDPGQSPEHR